MQEDFSEFQVGNWVVYLPERNYCIIKSFWPEIILEGALQNFYPKTFEQIGKIKITQDKLQVCGFEVQYPKFTKKFNDEIYITILYSGVYKVYKNDEEFCTVQFIHQVQNAYYNITGELLRGNLWGVREN